MSILEPVAQYAYYAGSFYNNQSRFRPFSCCAQCHRYGTESVDIWNRLKLNKIGKIGEAKLVRGITPRSVVCFPEQNPKRSIIGDLNDWKYTIDGFVEPNKTCIQLPYAEQVRVVAISSGPAKRVQSAKRSMNSSFSLHRSILALLMLTLLAIFWERNVVETRCKFVDNNILVCEPQPHANRQEWRSIDSMSSIQEIEDIRAIVVLGSDLTPWNLLKFERNVISRAPSLNWLMVTASRMTYIPHLQHCSELMNLSVSFNEIDRVNAFEFSGTNLVSLDLSHNRISFIHEHAFHAKRQHGNIKFIFGLQLTHIHLQNNRLTRVQPEWFRNLNNLRMVDLRNNFIAHIHPQTFIILRPLNHVVHVKFDEYDIDVQDGIARKQTETFSQWKNSFDSWILFTIYRTFIWWHSMRAKNKETIISQQTRFV